MDGSPIRKRKVAFLQVVQIKVLFFILFDSILSHTNNITNYLRKEEERMMTIVARRPKRNYKAYVNLASSITTLQSKRNCKYGDG